ncbi:hypothetical protein DPMN_055236 [Dreissena polymorpha]|uniref:Uncharacterized protein n=1 Tax=Dreissena polymorpha TaxID=45954 RepID=A0A9D4CR94_DREPO|nr:hypothetical protein DPMN_055236 [Dreissena polymorpha]
MSADSSMMGRSNLNMGWVVDSDSDWIIEMDSLSTVAHAGTDIWDLQQPRPEFFTLILAHAQQSMQHLR